MDVVLPIDESDVRLVPEFDADAAVRAALDRAGLPADARVAFVAVADRAGARVAVMTNLGLGSKWSFSCYADKPWHKPLTAGAQLAAWF